MPRSRKRKQGQAKTERVNESEPMQASSDQPSAKRLMPMYEPHVKNCSLAYLNRSYTLGNAPRRHIRDISAAYEMLADAWLGLFGVL